MNTGMNSVPTPYTRALLAAFSRNSSYFATGPAVSGALVTWDVG